MSTGVKLPRHCPKYGVKLPRHCTKYNEASYRGVFHIERRIKRGVIMSKRMKSNLFLLLTAFIWGSAFVAQKVGADVGTFTFNGVRTFVAGLSLMPVILILDNIRKKKKNPDAEKNVKVSPFDITAGAASSDDGTVSSADSGTSRREPGKSGEQRDRKSVV